MNSNPSDPKARRWPITSTRLALVHHLIRHRDGATRQPKSLPRVTRRGHVLSGAMICGGMAVATILAISLLQILFGLAG